MNTFVDLVAQARSRNDLGVLVDAIPYHRYLGIKLGSHIACVRAEAWQDDPARPVLTPKSIF
ncbi:MAG: hypothetical protein O7I42_08615 [Alphaproteobacteria bacterium]|nr:hypothetical protein [Alphaproteobacteria bacterium]